MTLSDFRNENCTKFESSFFMKHFFLAPALLFTSLLSAQSGLIENDFSSLQSITYKGLSFVQKPYQRLNCEYANQRKKNKQIEWWADTVCSSVTFVDLQIFGDDKPVITEISRQLKEISLSYGEGNFYETPQAYCNSIADTAAVSGMIELSTEISVLDTFDKFISLNIGINEFAGGVHPNYYSVVKTFDVFSGNTLDLFQIIDKKFEKSFRKLLYVKFKKNYGLDALFAPDTKPEEFPIAENFALGLSGMFIYYNPYEITPYVVGAPELELSFTEISPYLNTYFKSLVAKAKSTHSRK